jgi:hypothetical protein
MNIKRIYNLPTVELGYVYPEWYNHSSFFYFMGREMDEERFNWQDAAEEQRVELELKASAEVDMHNYHITLEYVAIKFDGKYIGLCIGTDRPWGWTLYSRYITNYPLYQTMVAYLKAMYMRKPNCIIGETTDINDVDFRCGHVIDKRHAGNLRPARQEER